ncbi:DUF1441 family protein [Pseudoalteromonas sp. Of7M-16]|uniref:DUF1441 family protein n=1 Tax=Pseudoalteromonas sp. Of7M-16 TaxID=2917756 RepID=UPI001EF3DC47|nr:DUF1441 family protein [Pseudoalteromonas sp. Of7M-16]MCG7551559.1 DUF1441 family protein [Pseudoalteromonas sp. Of7M-16]
MASISKLSEAYAWNITRIAEAFNLHRDTVRKRLKESRVQPVGKKSGVDVYALAEVGPALFAQDTIDKNDGDIHDPSRMIPKDRKDYFQSERERLKFEEEIGELIKDSDYRLDLAVTLKAVVSFFESMPDKMERLRLFTPAQLDQLESMSDQFREELFIRILEVDTDNAG